MDKAKMSHQRQGEIFFYFFLLFFFSQGEGLENTNCQNCVPSGRMINKEIMTTFSVEKDTSDEKDVRRRQTGDKWRGEALTVGLARLSEG